MTTIFILGSKDDTGIENHVKRQLIKNYRITYFNGKTISESGKGYELLFIDAPHITSADVGRTIVILKKDAAIRKLPSQEKTTVIAFSENERQIRYLRNSSASIITCGFQKTDTISYTSFSEEQVVVSLNREITALSGRNILPLEIPLELESGDDIYSLLSFTALRLLLDDYGSEIGTLY